MNINEAFPSNYLKAADIKGRTIKVQMANVKMEDLDGQPKPVLFLHGKDKGIVLNKTNSMMIAHSFGPDTDSWNGQWIELYVEAVAFQGQIVDAIRIRCIEAPQVSSQTPTQTAQAPQTAAQAVKEASGPPLDDFDVPFMPRKDPC